MTVYVLAQISIHDRARYERYVSGFAPILKQHRGSLLAADEEPVQLEGDWGFDKAILLQFPDEAAARGWLESAEYRQIAVDRIAATTGIALLLHGRA